MVLWPLLVRRSTFPFGSWAPASLTVRIVASETSIFPPVNVWPTSLVPAGRWRSSFRRDARWRLTVLGRLSNSTLIGSISKVTSKRSPALTDSGAETWICTGFLGVMSIGPPAPATLGAEM